MCLQSAESCFGSDGSDQNETIHNLNNDRPELWQAFDCRGSICCTPGRAGGPDFLLFFHGALPSGAGLAPAAGEVLAGVLLVVSTPLLTGRRAAAGWGCELKSGMDVCAGLDAPEAPGLVSSGVCACVSPL